MITVEEAESIIRARMPEWGDTLVGIDQPVYRRSAEALIADRSYPPIHRIMMDGIAVVWESLVGGIREFPIAGVCGAGAPECDLPSPMVCFEVMTGAPLPRGADLVIPYEHLSIRDGVALLPRDNKHSYSRFENIHLRGSDFEKGELLLASGSQLHGPRWGIAASLGYARVNCRKTPKIKVISTGDELVDVEQTPLDHQVRCSNSHALKASLLQNGFSDVVLDHLPDDEGIVAAHYRENRNHFDVLIYSGGVSKGKFDYLPKMWETAGVEKYFHEVSQRPGKPLWFGVDHACQTAVLGLPGNPISALVCLHRYFIARRPLYAKLDQDIHFAKDLTYFVPVKIECSSDAVLIATPIVTRNSGEFAALATSDGFLELPKGQAVFNANESFRFFPWSGIGGNS